MVDRVDPRLAAGTEVDAEPSPWSRQDVILYHLGVGAGDPPTAPQELALTYEDGLRVLPSYAVIPAMPTADRVLDLPGLQVDRAMMLHGEQEVEILRPVPPESRSARTSGRLAAVFDKGSAALAVVETTTSDDDGPLFVNRYSMFLRGQGGFGGPRGPGQTLPSVEGEPDRTVLVRTLPQQALLYRLSGDRNPLHVDPAFAARAGFERPILHGLCSFGITARVATAVAFDGDPRAVRGLRTRFTGAAVPGETLVLRFWISDGSISATVSTERGTPVLRLYTWG